MTILPRPLRAQPARLLFNDRLANELVAHASACRRGLQPTVRRYQTREPAESPQRPHSMGERLAFRAAGTVGHDFFRPCAVRASTSVGCEHSCASLGSASPPNLLRLDIHGPLANLWPVRFIFSLDEGDQRVAASNQCDIPWIIQPVRKEKI